MINDSKIDNFVKQILDNLPTEVSQIKQDLEKNLKTAISAGLKKMDLVTREEFDVQAELLARTRAMLDEMEQKISDLEKSRD